MRPAEYEAMYRVEDTHWWYAALRRLAGNAVAAEARRAGRPLRVLDAGAGTGGMLARLQGLGEAIGLEIAPEGLHFCRERGLGGLVRGSVNSLPFSAESFDVAVSLDVLYHEGVPDDVAATRELARVLRPDGLLILNLPAYNALRGAHDAAIQTARRYTRRRVVQLLKQAGLRPERVTHWNTLLLPVAATSRLVSRLRPGDSASDVQPLHPAVNQTLSAILRLEAAWLSHIDLPLGLSVFALGRKSAGSRQGAAGCLAHMGTPI